MDKNILPEGWVSKNPHPGGLGKKLGSLHRVAGDRLVAVLLNSQGRQSVAINCSFVIIVMSVIEVIQRLMSEFNVMFCFNRRLYVKKCKHKYTFMLFPVLQIVSR